MPKKNISVHLTDRLSFEMIFIDGGVLLLGNESQHKVTLKSFYLGKYQVTQEVWESVMGNNPATFQGKNRPVEQVSWDDTQQFIRFLKRRTGKSFRLPSESEWEYAARGGRYSQGYTYAGSDKLSQVGWYEGNSNDETHEVGLLLPNELGLYDMSGNVSEWCTDDWHYNYDGAPANGSAWVDTPDRGAGRVLRGGGYFNTAEFCRPAIRGRDAPDFRLGIFGFRLAMSLQSVG